MDTDLREASGVNSRARGSSPQPRSGWDRATREPLPPTADRTHQPPEPTALHKPSVAGQQGRSVGTSIGSLASHARTRRSNGERPSSRGQVSHMSSRSTLATQGQGGPGLAARLEAPWAAKKCASRSRPQHSRRSSAVSSSEPAAAPGHANTDSEHRCYFVAGLCNTSRSRTDAYWCFAPPGGGARSLLTACSSPSDMVPNSDV